MVMRLLPKSEIDRAKATEKKREIDEGLKIAQRIDNLRETQAETETALEKWRRETVALIHEEISKEAYKRDELKGLNARLERERDELQKPLDDEWVKVRAKDIELDFKGEDLAKKEFMLRDKEAKLAEAQKELALAEKRVADLEDHARSVLSGALAKDTSAQALYEDAARVKGEAQKAEQATIAELTHRERIVSGRESGATIREAQIETEKKALQDGWRLLKDRELMLERNLKRNQ